MKNFMFIVLTVIGLNCAFALPGNGLKGNDSNQWLKIKIPGAKCGLGADYSVFLRPQSEKKFLIEFMGAGACWNLKSCVTMPTTWVYPMVELSSYSTLTSARWEPNPFKEYSFLYLPYCTGDVFTGNRISTYEGVKIYHYGYRNVILTLNYLRDKKLIKFDRVEDLIVWGSSAGGIGALTHGKHIENYFPSQTKKVLIADSPGLHFGSTFWDKFDSDAHMDFKKAFNHIHLDVDFHDGFVARKIGPVLEHYKNWKLGFLIGLRDSVMSRFFGEISPTEHQKLVLGHEGLPAIAARYPHVQVWLSDSSEHRFLLTKKAATSKSIQNLRAIDFVKGISDK
ncbi:MAG: hypothetical protein JNL11_12080 [Bdellovibrionaceae bacterium]|nr:hypothetical protein [Pseudobdellovibrionaceae bacterium]